jgi:PhnB protein
MHLNPYLLFNGSCEEAFKFYAKTLNGTIKTMMTFEGSPMEKRVPDEWRKKIMHSTLVFDGQILMGSDARSEHYRKPQGITVSLSVDKPEEAERIFAALAEGGEVGMALQETFWAARFGMLTDRFGIPWMVNCEKETH